MSSTISRDSLLAQLNWRYAVKAFDPNKKISAADWATLEQALVLTPTSYGLQPLRYVVVTDQAIKDQFVPHSWGQKQPADASHFVIFAAKLSVSEADVDHFMARIAEVRGISVDTLAGYRNVIVGQIVKGLTAEQQQEWATRQCYIALGNLMTSAAVLGIDTCPMEGMLPAKYDEVLDLPAKGYKTVVACAVGYRSAEDKYATASKVRQPAAEVVISL
jgi:nitroreductase